ncbi:hypothetical protein [Aphanothece sacrum]|uniref:Uncharacterized protein n=1 Tax=Aphanothece sacrum FPU1 TaxID=1920663 RepID=A0A401IEH0_APHSA|nr:hypothetical protein [Aphanothece sacrum]GBF79609.1 hypothetical protein AsFPU1_1007 [Aphanothece sacrum FPU1]GBF87069.1 hypothetical protein AsFPU3_4150 [Aphanothece sacrum FPU3]
MLEDFQQELLEPYHHALSYIGVDFEREDVQEALEFCYNGFEAALQSVIEYWLWLKQRNQTIEYPIACLINALNQQWKPSNWEEEWLNLPEFKRPSQRWWEAAYKQWGKDTTNQLIADVSDSHITFMNYQRITLKIAYVWGWQRTYHYAIEQLPKNHLLRVI